ncbi:MFS transporter [Streptomyces yerevanensis]|uniref:MFS transporter n=1 Tax=Streptomyces yerevanensis TaxID=66378 RepID=UPI000B1948C0|nr:MFS transporter [Streptomyces yerevanensis]
MPDSAALVPERSRPWRGVPGFLAGATALAALGLAAGGTAGTLLATDLADTPAVAGLPVALHLSGSAVGALLVSHQGSLGHRGRGLALGLLIGAVGAAIVVLAAARGSLPLMLAGSTLLGTANSSIFLVRYAAAQAVPDGSRGQALGTVFFATAFGAVLSPLLFGPSSSVARAAGFPALAGPYLVALAAFSLSALLLAAGTTPRVPLLGRAARVLTAGTRGTPGGLRLQEALRTRATAVALCALAGANFVMVGIMTIVPVHLDRHGAGHGIVGFLVALHVVGMFAVAPVTGRLADQHGPVPVVLAGAVVSLGACVLGAFGDGGATPMTTVYLVLAGLGWNAGVVGASALLTESAPESVRTHAEGIGEATMGAAAVVAAPLVAAVPAVWALPLLGVCAGALTLLATAELRRVPADRRDPIQRTSM